MNRQIAALALLNGLQAVFDGLIVIGFFQGFPVWSAIVLVFLSTLIMALLLWKIDDHAALRGIREWIEGIVRGLMILASPYILANVHGAGFLNQPVPSWMAIISAFLCFENAGPLIEFAARYLVKVLGFVVRFVSGWSLYDEVTGGE